MRLLLAVILSLGFTSVAVAQSCGSLRAQLATAQAGTGGGGASQAKLRQQASAYGCNKSSRWGQHQACAGILAQLNRGSNRGDRAKIRRLERQISRKCNQPREVRRETRQRRQVANAPRGDVIIHGTRPDNHLDARSERRDVGFLNFGRLFGADRRDVVAARTRNGEFRGEAERVSIDERELKRAARRAARVPAEVMLSADNSKRPLRVGSTRTVCVRLCDGFYFPINSKSHNSNFRQEYAMCVGRCPGADVSLYAHGAGSAVETMRSTLTGESYVALPTAFNYRKKRVDGCGCQPATQIAGELDADKALGYVGIGSSKAEEAAEALAQSKPGEGWNRPQAVFDETGEPLTLAIGGKAVTHPSQNGGGDAALTATLTRAVLSGDDATASAEAVLASDTKGVREVGPRFLASQSQDGIDRERPRPRFRSTAVDLLPVPATAVPTTLPRGPEIDDDRADGISASNSEPAPYFRISDG